MLLLITRTLNMLKNQIAAQGRAFEQSGGFSERLTACRVEARNAQTSPECPECPKCPECGGQMCRRHSTRGDFWGCRRYPDCRGTRQTGPD